MKTMYKTISRSKLESLYRQAQTLIANRNGVASEYNYIMSCYSSSNALAGYTDYRDHRKDTLPQIKRMIREQLKSRQCQLGSYFNSQGQAFDQVRVELKNGGWSAYPQWSDGSQDFFTEERHKYTALQAQRKAQHRQK
jgi:hypothetical protein